MEKNPLTSRERRGLLIMLGAVMTVVGAAVWKGYVATQPKVEIVYDINERADSVEILATELDRDAKSGKHSLRRKKSKKQNSIKNGNRVQPRDFLNDTVSK
ncbi:MAG: hypothetical protein NC328_00195 [Muribaculum sp.]|nr:hypothetical protein [Muribaculum sp.]